MRIGVIGTGEWAQTLHLPTLARLDRVELAGVWGRDAAHTRAAADRFGISAFPEVNSLIEAVDIVSVAVAPEAAPDYAEAAAAAGRHLLLEKPIASEPHGARRVVDKVSECDVRAVVFLTRLFEPQQRAWLDQQKAKRPRRVTVSWRSAAMRPDSPFAGGWRDGADALLDVGPHIVAQFEHLLGPMISAQTERSNRTGQSEYTFEHEGGGTSQAILNLHDPDADEERYGITAAGSAATRNVRLNSSMALSAAVDQLLRDSASPADSRAPWSVDSAAHALDVITGLREEGAWTAGSPAGPWQLLSRPKVRGSALG
jgi:predicted dehydrogenase